MQRFNISLTDELHAYFKNESERTGVSMSALMIMALQSYVEERNALKMMKDFPDFMTFIQKYEESKKINNEDK